MTTRTPEEKAYLKGFYAALKGILYCCEDAESTVGYIRDAVLSTLEEMENAGDLEDIDSEVDELIDLVKDAEAMGKTEELFKLLDERFGGK